MPISPIVGVFDAAGTNLSPTESAGNLFISNNQSPPGGLGSVGDWFFLTTNDQLQLYQKGSSSWATLATFQGIDSQNISGIENAINQLQASANTTTALISTNQQEAYTTTTALASQITQLTAQVNSSVASINTTLKAMVTASFVQASISQQIAAATATTNAKITSEAQTRASSVSALTTQVNDIQAILNGVQTQSKAEVFIEQGARVSADQSLAYQITTVSVSVAGVAASVVTEATARATADGHLSANYSVTVTAGDVVTGMQLNSSSGGGATISTVTFTASVFQIYNGSSGQAVFTASSGSVQIAGYSITSTTLTANGIELDSGNGQIILSAIPPTHGSYTQTAIFNSQTATGTGSNRYAYGTLSLLAVNQTGSVVGGIYLNSLIYSLTSPNKWIYTNSPSGDFYVDVAGNIVTSGDLTVNSQGAIASYFTVGQNVSSLTAQMELFGMSTANAWDLIVTRTRGGGNNNPGFLFRNDYWTINSTAGLGAISAVDNTSSGGELHFMTTRSGGGSSGTPSNSLVVLNDATLQIYNNGGTPGTPSGSGYLYVSGGSLMYKGSSGTVTTIASA